MHKVPTPGTTRCEDVAALLGAPLTQTVKAIAVMHKDEFILLLVRGDHSLNEIKTQKLPGMDPFRFATDAEVERHLGCLPGYIGPVGADAGVRIIADHAVAVMADFICGANQEGYHLAGANFGRDLPGPGLVADIRNVVPGDPSPDGKGKLDICRGIEVGHIFQLRTKYSEAMKAVFLDESGKPRAFEMGCYGIGVTRIVAAAIEQNHDARGIVFPQPIAPFQLALVPIGYRKSAQVREICDRLYLELVAAGIEVLMDDRDERPGVMFADMELIGIPHRVVVGERGLKQGKLEYQGRRDQASTPVGVDELPAYVKARLCAH
jgi:prolyl-tRNA synthetase